MGAGTQVVAVDQDSDYPPGVPVTSLSGLTPNIEAIAKYNPSLVIASQNSGGLVSGLGKLGIPVLIEPAVSTLSARLPADRAARPGDRPLQPVDRGREEHAGGDHRRRAAGRHQVQGHDATTGS